VWPQHPAPSRQPSHSSLILLISPPAHMMPGWRLHAAGAALQCGTAAALPPTSCPRPAPPASLLLLFRGPHQAGLTHLRIMATTTTAVETLTMSKCLVNGELVEAPSSFPVVNPSTGEPFASAPHADAAMVQTAIDAAAAAFPAWAATPIEERRARLAQAREVLMAHEAELAELLTKEQGKPLPMALAECAWDVGAAATPRLSYRPRVLLATARCNDVTDLATILAYRWYVLGPDAEDHRYRASCRALLRG
jgi:hypothetical protein